MTNSILFDLAVKTGQCLIERDWMLATAESCTGGGLGHAITAVPGSSGWYDRGFVTYSNLSKCEMLGVRQSTLDQYGAVSPQTATEMVLGALARSSAQIAVSITGVAGPGGGTDEKPVGMVCFAWATQDHRVQQQTLYFKGDRETIRQLAIAAALQGILDLIGDSPIIV